MKIEYFLIEYDFLVPDALKLYDKLNVKHTPLKLISPQFEAPFPPLQAAVSKPN